MAGLRSPNVYTIRSAVTGILVEVAYTLVLLAAAALIGFLVWRWAA